MEDRFKFRYFNKKANKMVEPENWQNVDGIYECLKQQVCFDEDISPLQYNHTGDGLVFMQSTGLRDKNGKLIYEADIVKLQCNREDKGGLFYQNAVVIYDIVDTFSGFSLSMKNDKYALWRSHKMEIIGNIWENKDLLKEVEE